MWWCWAVMMVVVVVAVFCGARGASRGVRKILEALEEGLRKVLEAIPRPTAPPWPCVWLRFPFLILNCVAVAEEPPPDDPKTSSFLGR